MVVSTVDSFQIVSVATESTRVVYSVGSESTDVVNAVEFSLVSDSIDVEIASAFSVISESTTTVDEIVELRNGSVICIPSHVFWGSEMRTAVSPTPLMGCVATTINEKKSRNIISSSVSGSLNVSVSEFCSLVRINAELSSR